MTDAVKFSRELKKLLDLRTARLRSAIGKKRLGPTPALTKKKVKSALKKLSATARKIIVKQQARNEFKKTVIAKRQWHVKSKGWGVQAKKVAFKHWYAKRIRGHNCIYIFWSGRKCQYVGRTLRGKGRPTGSFDKFWFGSVTRIDIYPIATPTIVPKAECLAVHVFEPRKNAIRPARPKFSKPCPICTAAKEIKRELNSIFPLTSIKGKIRH
jgi:hypothetical protein